MACCTAWFPTAAAASLAHAINHLGSRRHPAGTVFVQAWLRPHEIEIGRAWYPGSASLHTGNLSLLWTWKSRICSHCKEVGGSVHLLWLTRLLYLLGQGIKPQAHGPNVFTLHLVAPGAKHWPANAIPRDTPWGWFSQEGKQLEWCRIYRASRTAQGNSWGKAVVG